MIPIERRHVKFWQDFFGLPLTALGARRQLELALYVGVCRLFGAPAIHLVLEAIEVYGVRKYLKIWDIAVGTPLESGLRGILRDEFEHEDAVVTGDDERRINPERIRNIFLGLNDGLVEIVGAVSGFFGAFGDPGTVLIAGSTTAVAGALSMAAGAFVASSSESEVRETELARQRFLGEASAASGVPEPPLLSASLVGASYLAGALVPMLPIALGAQSALPSVVGAGAVIVAVSMILAFLSGMNIRRRVLMNLGILAAAAALSYGIGVAAQRLFGIATT
jgi:VIT1/CCC1 family predicted Fe2+/Mn2+ transporter